MLSEKVLGQKQIKVDLFPFLLKMHHVAFCGNSWILHNSKILIFLYSSPSLHMRIRSKTLSGCVKLWITLDAIHTLSSYTQQSYEKNQFTNQTQQEINNNNKTTMLTWALPPECPLEPLLYQYTVMKLYECGLSL